MDEDSDNVKFSIVDSDVCDFELKKESKLIKCHTNAHNLKERLKQFTKQDIVDGKLQVMMYQQTMLQNNPELFGAAPLLYYVHFDLDAFYASCEELVNPKLKSIPVGIGSTIMLATCNYNARKYGIKAGMPGYKAKRLCPQLKIVKLNFPLYNSKSNDVMNVLSTYCVRMEIYGMDEACLIFDNESFKKAIGKVKCNELNENIKYSNTSSFDYESINWLVNYIRSDVANKTGLTVSAGISVSRGLAKFASDVKKPNGQYTIDKNFQEFLDKLDVDEINGIGKYTKELLNKTFGIFKIADLKEKMPLVFITMPYKSFYNLFQMAYGLIVFDRQDAKNLSITKSIGRGTTFIPTVDYSFICQTLWDCSKDVSCSLISKNYFSKTLSIYVRYHDFESFTKQKKLMKPVRSSCEIFETAFVLLNEALNHNNVKGLNIVKMISSIGIRMENLNTGFGKIEALLSSTDRLSVVKFCPICSYNLTHFRYLQTKRHIKDCKEKRKMYKASILYYINRNIGS